MEKRWPWDSWSGWCPKEAGWVEESIILFHLFLLSHRIWNPPSVKLFIFVNSFIFTELKSQILNNFGHNLSCRDVHTFIDILSSPSITPLVFLNSQIYYLQYDIELLAWKNGLKKSLKQLITKIVLSCFRIWETLFRGLFWRIKITSKRSNHF